MRYAWTFLSPLPIVSLNIHNSVMVLCLMNILIQISKNLALLLEKIHCRIGYLLDLQLSKATWELFEALLSCHICISSDHKEEAPASESTFALLVPEENYLYSVE